MQFRKAGSDDCRAVTDVVQNTKAEIYPGYYPKEVVAFFANLHCYDHVMQDVVSGLVYVLEVEGRIVGTGSFRGNHITRVYILPDSQGMGYGKYIVAQLEGMMREYDEITLDASLPACAFYEHLGYQTDHHERYECDNGAVLIYDIMSKKLK